MPEVDGNDPEVRAAPHINLIPCATRDEANPDFSHAYEARRVVKGEVVAVLGWSTLAEARERFEGEPYAVRFGSHSICAACFEQKFGLEE